MLLEELKSKFISNGWKDENINNLPNFSLYTGVECILSYKGKVFMQYHPEHKYIRLIISGIHETLITDEQGYIKKAMMDDSVGLQLSYNGNLKDTVSEIIKIQDDLKIEEYIFLSMEFNKVCSCSILALEQFLDKDEYLKSVDRQYPRLADAESVLNQTTEMCQRRNFKQAQTTLLSYLKKEGKMNIHLYYNLLYTCTTPGIEPASKEDIYLVIEQSINFLDSLNQINDYFDAYLFFIARSTLLMIQANRPIDCVKAIQNYKSLGGNINSDILLNYSHSASTITDINLQKTVLEEMIYFFNKQPELFSKENTSYLYTSDNIACLAAAVFDKENMLKYLRISKELDPEFINNKTYDGFKNYWQDSDFLALFD